MKITTIMFYRPEYEKTRLEVRYYDSVQAADLAAQHMLDQFKYWGGGSVPVSIVQTRWTTKGSKTLYHYDYDPAEWMPFSRKAGNLYGYYEFKHGRASA